MTNNEVLKVKDLLCRANCIGRECKKCPYYNTAECINKADTHLLRKYVYELKDENNRQKAEIERLEKVHKSLEEAYREQENYEDMIIEGAEVCARCHEEYAEKIKQAKAEAVKELIEKLTEEYKEYTLADSVSIDRIFLSIKHIARRMAGEN